MRCVSSRSIFILIKTRSGDIKANFLVGRPWPPYSPGAGVLISGWRLPFSEEDDEHTVHTSDLACPCLSTFAQQHLSRKFNKAYLPSNFDAAAVIHCAGAYCGRLCEQYELAHVESVRLRSLNYKMFYFLYLLDAMCIFPTASVCLG